jgi:predicted  nucleic acid-binding Zn-ribbon protein
MNSTVQLLLRLHDLNLLRQSLELAGAYVEEAGFDFLEERIDRLRREIPGAILSQYDSLARCYTEPVAAASRNLCQGCGKPIPTRLTAELEQSRQLCRCPNCGRFLYRHESAPDYLNTK